MTSRWLVEGRWLTGSWITDFDGYPTYAEALVWFNKLRKNPAVRSLKIVREDSTRKVVKRYQR